MNLILYEKSRFTDVLKTDNKSQYMPYMCTQYMPELSALWWQKYELKFEITAFRMVSYREEEITVESLS